MILLYDKNQEKMNEIINFLTPLLVERRVKKEFIKCDSIKQILKYKKPFAYVINIESQDSKNSAFYIRKKEPKANIIYYTSNLRYVPPQHYFNFRSVIVRGFDKERVEKILDEMLGEDREDFFYIYTHDKEIRKNARDLIYVDIEDRSLHFVFLDGDEIYSKKITKSFKEEIKKYIEQFSDIQDYCFIKPTFFLNLNYITEVGKNFCSLINGEVRYYPEDKIKKLRIQWKKHFN